ncbi:MAG: glycosyltransferase family 4 protein [Planctomycetota bacterium]|nr:glycosyltransferase family 4 protein [Planctomycetota bacterium]
MRIVHIITRLILGGAQENTLLSVEGQQDDWGDAVTLITGPALGPEGSLLDRATAGGRDVRVLPEMRREIHPGRDWKSYQTLRRWLHDLNPEIVHTHSSKAGVLGRAAAWSVGIPVVHTIHGSPFHAYQSRVAYQLYRGLERWAARRCDRLVSVCDAMTDQYVAAGVAPREKFETVYSGMEVEPFLNPPRPRDVVRQELHFAPTDVVVAKIARLFELKGHADVIAAARTVGPADRNVKFLFIGDGLLHSELEREIASAGLADRFVFTGLVPPQRVPELLGASDMVVHASLREGLARVLPQGLIAGKPVISYDVDGAREVVITGETGFLLPPRDIPGMAQAILRLSGDPALRARLGETGRARFTEQFRHQTMTRRLREVYERVLADRRLAVTRNGG